MQDHEMDLKRIESKMDSDSPAGKRMAASLLDDTTKHLKQLTKVINLLKRLHTSKIDDKTKPTELAELMRLCDAAVARTKDIKDWGERFGYVDVKRQRKGKNPA